MQDRFKFRVWEKDQKVMKDVTQITIDKDQTGSMCGVKGKVTAHLIYQPHYILMQCTGLKDKNGKLIFEGDILADAKHKYIVEWSLSDGYFIRKPWICELFCYRIDKETTRNTKIIGNIYENPELLGGEE